MQLKLKDRSFATLPLGGRESESKSYELSGSRALLYRVLDVVLLAALSGFICFYKLDSFSLYIPDEVFEVQAALEMMHGERWWLPTHNGEPWLHKPPLKMWLTWPAVNAFSSPNFAFRFIDATTGVALTLILYFFSLALFNSRIAGLGAGIGFLGCDIMVRYHGFRSANQDSLLLLFATLSLIAAWYVIQRQSWTASILGGLALGAAVLTKSAAGLIGLIICGTFCICSGRFFEIVAKTWKQMLVVLGLASGVIASYFVPVCLAVEGACGEYFTENIYGRILKGYHNVEGPWFYLERLFVEGGAIPPSLLVLSLILGSWLWWTKKDERFGYLVFWAAVPVACFSISKIKLSWYIASSLCGMALLLGASMHWLLNSKQPPWLKLSLGGLASLLLLWNLALTFESIAKPRKRIELDHIVENIRQFEGGETPSAAVFGASTLAMKEMPYALLLNPQWFKPEEEADVIKLANDGQLDYLFVRSSLEDRVFSQAKPSHVLRLPAYSNRYTWFSIFAYTGETAPHGFEVMEHYLNFGTGNVRVVRDIGPADAMKKKPIRWSLGPNPEFVVPGNRFLENKGGLLTLNFAFHRGAVQDKLDVRVLFNGEQIANFKPRAGRFDMHRLPLRPGLVHTGDNSVRLELTWASGKPVNDYDRLLLLDWATLELPKNNH